MALTGEAAIGDALFWKLSQLTLSPDIPVALPNIDFDPPAGPYLRSSFQPNGGLYAPIRFEDDAHHRGLFQVSIHWPGGVGVIKAYEAAKTIKDHFDRGTEIIRNGVKVCVDEEPRVAGHLQEGGNRIMIPVTILWSER